MLNAQQLAALLIKVAVAASIASILMRFSTVQRILLRDNRSIRDRLQLAFVVTLLFGSSAGVRVLTHGQYPAIDVAFEGAIIAGLVGGYVTGLVTGLCVSIPDMFTGHFMSMPLYAAAGILGAVMHDLARQRDDIWYFSAFVDLNLWRLFRKIMRLHTSAIQRRVVERAAFNVACNAIVVLAELFRWAVHASFPVHNTFFLFDLRPPIDRWTFAASAAATLFAVSLPLRIWSSFRTERQLETQRARLTEARLAALTNQINPHFLFNTLNSISSLIRIDPDRARGMIYKLSSILRRLLRMSENFSPLREEISFIDDYLAIEMARFPDKLRFYKEIDENTLDRPVPSMILQPIIENSIKHGLSSKVEGGSVRLRAWLEGTRLHLLIEDDGVGMPDSTLDKIFEEGIGISNVNERLHVLFGSGYAMRIESKLGQGTRTWMEIPDVEEYTSAPRAPTLTSRV